MVSFILGFATCYILAAWIVWEERDDYFQRTAEKPSDVPASLPLTLALLWPRTIGRK